MWELFSFTVADKFLMDPLLALARALSFMLDFKVIVALLGWKFLNQVLGLPLGQQRAGARDESKVVQEVQAAADALKERLSEKEEEVAKKEREVASAAARLQEAEFARLTLEAQVCQLEARGVRLEADLEAAAAQAADREAALAAENHALAAALEVARAGIDAAGAAEGATAGGGDEAVLHSEIAALRAQLEAVSAQNADLQERLMAIAFMAPPEPADSLGGGGGGAMFSPEQAPARRPRHRPLAEDEEIQRRIAQSAAQVKLFEEEGQQPGSPLLAAAQAQLAAFQQVEQQQRVSSEGKSTQEEGEAEFEFSSRFTSGTGSPDASGSPTGVLSHRVSGAGGSKARRSVSEVEGEAEVASGLMAA